LCGRNALLAGYRRLAARRLAAATRRRLRALTLLKLARR
jgi:hypothetical protein